MSAVFFVLFGASHQPSPPVSTPRPHPVDAPPQAPPTDCEAPPTAKPAVVRQTSPERNAAPPGDDEDNRSAVDSDAEYGSVSESMEPMLLDSGDVTSPVPRSLNTDRDLHLAQLMESIL